MLLRTILLLIVFSMPVFAEELSGFLATDKQQAEIYAKEKQWQNLERLGAQWAEKDNSNWESWYYLGLGLFNQNKFQESVKALLTAMKLSKKENGRIMQLYADAQVRLENWNEADLMYQKILAKRQNNYEIWNKLLTVVINQASVATVSANVTIQYEGVTSVYAKVLSFGAYINNETYWRDYSEVLKKIGDDDGVREAYAHVLRLNPKDINIVEWVFLFDQKKGDDERLQATSKHLQRLMPNHPFIQIELARKALQEKNKGQAKRLYLTISENKKYPYQQAEALTGLGKLEKNVNKSLNYFLSAIQADPTYMSAWEEIIVIYRFRRDKVREEKYFSRMQYISQLLAKNLPVTRDVLKNL